MEWFLFGVFVTLYAIWAANDEASEDKNKSQDLVYYHENEPAKVNIEQVQRNNYPDKITIFKENKGITNRLVCEDAVIIDE